MNRWQNNILPQAWFLSAACLRWTGRDRLSYISATNEKCIDEGVDEPRINRLISVCFAVVGTGDLAAKTMDQDRLSTLPSEILEQILHWHFQYAMENASAQS